MYIHQNNNNHKIIFFDIDVNYLSQFEEIFNYNVQLKKFSNIKKYVFKDLHNIVLDNLLCDCNIIPSKWSSWSSWSWSSLSLSSWSSWSSLCLWSSWPYDILLSLSNNQDILIFIKSSELNFYINLFK